MTFENILISKENSILTLTINRPEKLNALNKALIQEMHDAMKEIEKDNEVRVVVITGSGAKAFVAGADISEFSDFSIEEGAQLAAQGQELLFNLIENFSKPVIAAVNGFALGGGLELAMACHFRVASDNAKMGLPEVSLGVIPGYGGTQRLPQLVGKGKAMELIMTAGMLTADEAKELKLVNYVVTQDELLAHCYTIAPMAIRKAIKAVNANFQYGVNGYETEIKAFGYCFGTADFKEGTTAFLEKRKAVFAGE